MPDSTKRLRATPYLMRLMILPRKDGTAVSAFLGLPPAFTTLFFANVREFRSKSRYAVVPTLLRKRKCIGVTLPPNQMLARSCLEKRTRAASTAAPANPITNPYLQGTASRAADFRQFRLLQPSDFRFTISGLRILHAEPARQNALTNLALTSIIVRTSPTDSLRKFSVRQSSRPQSTERKGSPRRWCRRGGW